MTNDKIPDDKQAEMITFLKCRKEIAKKMLAWLFGSKPSGNQPPKKPPDLSFSFSEAIASNGNSKQRQLPSQTPAKNQTKLDGSQCFKPAGQSKWIWYEERESTSKDNISVIDTATSTITWWV